MAKTNSGAAAGREFTIPVPPEQTAAIQVRGFVSRPCQGKENSVPSASGHKSETGGAMTRFRLRRISLTASFLALSIGMTSNVHAQMVDGDLGATFDNIGINLTNGVASIKDQTISIGTKGNGGIDLQGTLVEQGWTHNFVYKIIGLIPAPLDDPEVTRRVTLGSSAKEYFEQNGYKGTIQDGSSLVKTPLGYTYTDHDGTIVNFIDASRMGEDIKTNLIKAYIAIATSIVRPNGETITLNYYEVPGARRRLQSVDSNFGYHLHFNYVSDQYIPVDVNLESTNYREWNRIASVQAINLAVDYCNSFATTCGSLSQTWPSIFYSWTYSGPINNLTTTRVATDSSGNSMTQVGNSNTQTLTVTRGAVGSPEFAAFVFNYGFYSQSLRVSSVVAPTGTWGYSWVSPFDGNATRLVGTRTDPSGFQRQSKSWLSVGRMEQLVDELGRTTTFQYAPYGTATLTNVIRPEGTMSGTTPIADYTNYTYDTRGNVIQSTEYPKAGSGLPNIVTSAGFDAICSNRKTCNQPNWVRDAKVNQTDFTYAPEHGGVLTEMKPAPAAGAARPLTINTYAQRSAWIKNESGALVQSLDPVWLPASKTECQTAAGSNTPVCDGAAPQTVTTLEYGASGTSEAMLVKGVAVSSGGVTLRTCYRYDIYHRRISETTPNANLGACP